MPRSFKRQQTASFSSRLSRQELQEMFDEEGEETEGEEPADYIELVWDLVRGKNEDKSEGAGAEERKGAGAEGGKTSRSTQPVSGDLDTFLDSFLAQQAHRCNLSHGTWHAM